MTCMCSAAARSSRLRRVATARSGSRSKPFSHSGCSRCKGCTAASPRLSNRRPSELNNSARCPGVCPGAGMARMPGTISVSRPINSTWWRKAIEAPPGGERHSPLDVIAHAQAAQVHPGGGPEIPFRFRHHIPGIGEHGQRRPGISPIDGAPDVVRMGVGEDHGGHVPRPYAGHLQAGQNGAGSARPVAHPGIGQDNFAAGLDQEAGVGAEDGLAVRPAPGQSLGKLRTAGIRKIPGGGIRDVAIAEDGAPQSSDLEAMRTRWHNEASDNCIKGITGSLSDFSTGDRCRTCFSLSGMRSKPGRLKARRPARALPVRFEPAPPAVKPPSLKAAHKHARQDQANQKKNPEKTAKKAARKKTGAPADKKKAAVPTPDEGSIYSRGSRRAESPPQTEVCPTKRPNSRACGACRKGTMSRRGKTAAQSVS